MSGKRELAPCPFCGGVAERQREWGGKLAGFVCCANHECLGYHFEQDEQGGWSHEKTLPDAIAAWNRRAPSAELSASRAEVVALREALEEAARRFDGLSHIHDGNPSDAMADTPPLDYARHMLWEARRECREGAREARAALAGEKPVGAGVETDDPGTQRIMVGVEVTGGELSPQATALYRNFTVGHCAERRKPGGCQLHNLHCAYPECDRRAALSKSGEKP